MTSLDKYFKRLELEPGASLDQIKQAYRDLAQIWHPDRYSHNPRLRTKAEERFKDINEAYQKLTSEARNFSYTQPPQPKQNTTRSEPPRSPPPAPQPETPAKKHWGRIIFPIISLFLIRSCFDARHSPNPPTHSYLTYQQPTLAPTIKPPTPAEAVFHMETAPIPKFDIFDQLPAIPSTPNDDHAKLTTPIVIQTPPSSQTIQSIPSAEFKNIELSFSRPGPEVRGTLRNNTEWSITGASVVVIRQYVPVFTPDDLVITLAVDYHSFDVKIPSGVIPPFTTQEIAVDIGHYLDSYEDSRYGNPSIRFRAKSGVTLESLRGYLQ